MTSNDQPDARARLRTYFENQDPTTHSTRWEDLWTDEFVPWDKGFPSPSLVDLLNTRDHLPPQQLAPPTGEKERPGQRIRRPRALVPGCGRGYDVLLFASHGYDSYGVESAQSAVKQATELSKGYEDKREEYRVRDEKVGRGEARFLEGDFYKDEWWQEICQGDAEGKTGFDVIYDYTVSRKTLPVYMLSFTHVILVLLRDASCSSLSMGGSDGTASCP